MNAGSPSLLSSRSKPGRRRCPPGAVAALLAASLLLSGAGESRGAGLPLGEPMGGMAGMQPGPQPAGGAEASPAVQQGATDSMAHQHLHAGAHMKMTAPQQPRPRDPERAAAILKTLRASVEKYRDYRTAIADGYLQYLPNVVQPIYHFTNWGNAYQAAFAFDPARPTSLLYKKTPGGFELLGAMYTAPQPMSEADLDQRVPLSVASWHQHVNICLPPKERYATSDWTKFGFAGAIATAEECTAAGGQFHPVIFGWMVHVYPFETDAAKIWAH